MCLHMTIGAQTSPKMYSIKMSPELTGHVQTCPEMSTAVSTPLNNSRHLWTPSLTPPDTSGHYLRGISGHLLIP